MITDNVLTVRSFKNERYKTKEYRKEDFKPFLYLSKSEFKKYSKENDVAVAGSVKINQKHYEDIENADDPEKVLGKKYQKHIIGIFQAELDGVYTAQSFDDDSLNLSKMQKFDLYEKLSFYHCIGYAYVGGKKFVKLCKFSLIPFLILLLLLLGLLICFLFPVNSDLTQAPPIADGDTITNEPSSSNTEQAPLCYFEPLPKEITLNSDNRNVQLKNVSENKGNYYINYEIYINDELQYLIIENKTYYISDTGTQTFTGLIQPGDSVTVNCYNALDAGTYDLTCKAIEYDYSTKEEQLLTYDLKTVLIIDK